MPRTNLQLPQGKGFTIKELLTEVETSELVKKAEVSGFASIEWEYHKTYRDCTRVILRDEGLADKLWKRLLPHLCVDDLAVRPFGYGADGFWVPKGVNPLFRITKYTPGGHFSVHRDGGFVVTDDFRSIYTLMIYLQKPYQGGDTKFFDSSHDVPLSLTRQMPPRVPVATVAPEEGTALLFTHDVAHEGAEVLQGDKYVLRTDLLFERTLRLGDGSHQADPLYQAAEKLYQDSIRLQKEGAARASTEAYVRATEIHARLSSAPPNGVGCHLAALHTDIVEELLPWLQVRDVAVMMQTCRALMYKCRSPAHWFIRYRTDFKQGLVRIENTDQIVIHDWFVLYGSRLLVEKYLPVVCVDIGARYTKFATTQLKCDRLLTERWGMCRQWGHQTGPDPVLSGEFRGKINSVFCRNRGHYWSAGSGYCDIMSRVDDGSYEHWLETTNRMGGPGYKFFPYSYPVAREFEDGIADIEINVGVWMEIIGFISGYCIQNHHAQNPVILAFPPRFAKKEVQGVLLKMMPRIPAGFVAVVSSPVLVAARHRVRDAVVVSVGARFAWVSVVQNLRVTKWKDRYLRRFFCVQLTQGPKAAEADKRVVKNLADALLEVRKGAVHCQFPVLVTGGYAELYRPAISEAAGIPERDMRVSPEPDMDVAVGGVYYATQPEARENLLKTPLVQTPDSWWSKKQKLDWESMESALKRHRLPTLGDSQARMWDILQNI
jgi:hypothetical protein